MEIQQFNSIDYYEYNILIYINYNVSLSGLHPFDTFGGKHGNKNR